MENPNEKRGENVEKSRGGCQLGIGEVGKSVSAKQHDNMMICLTCQQCLWVRLAIALPGYHLLLTK